MSYTLPQVMVYQDVTQVPTAVVSSLNPYIYGANYSLRRYTEAAEKALIALGLYSSTAGNTAAYPNKVAGSVVDTGYVKVYADDAWLKYQNIPNSAANPLVLTSAGIRNKLRAAPRIVDGLGYNAAGTTTAVPGGCHTGTVALPEAYYFTFAEDFTLGTEAGSMDYLTTEGLSGTFDVAADATAADVMTQAVDGLVLNMTNGGAVTHPVKYIKFASSGGSYFTVAFTDLQGACDHNLTSGSDKYRLTVNDNAALEVTYATKLLTVKLGLTGAHATLTALRAAIVAVSAVLVDFTVSAIDGTGSEVVTLVTDQLDADLTAATALAMIPHVYKTFVYENTWVLKTANDYTRTASLYKDVEIGDKVKWTVTPASTGVQVSGYSTIVGLEADYTRPVIADAAAASGNQAPQTGVDLNAGVLNIVANPDNDNENFDMTASKTFSTAGDFDFPILSLAAGILSDDYIITVTKAGIKGVAEVSIANASGTYGRTAVPVEATGSDGQVYIGNNMYVNFVSTGSDKDFVLGNIYTVTAVSTPFTAVTNEVASGTFAGTTSTIYNIEVTRGGVFTRTAEVLPGLTTSGTLVADISGWLGGDVDDEYILAVTTAGTISSAVFSLKSQRGDNANGISFVATGSTNAIAAGASGMTLYFDAATTFAVGQYWAVLVRAARPKVKVTDSAGSDQETSSVVAAGGLISVGLNGVKLTFPANTNTLGGFASTGGLVLGDVFTIEATASEAGPVQTLVLADELPDDVTAGLETSGDANYSPDRFAADLMLVSASKLLPKEDRDPLVAAGGYNWTASSTALALKAGIKVQDSTWVDGMGEMPFLELIHGNLYVEYRSLLLDYSNAIYSVGDITLVEAQLGPIVADNPLALAVYSNLENLGSRTCYFSAITSDDVTGDAGALSKAGLVKYTYALNPAGVTDPARHALLEAHIASMATEIKKRWRLGLVGRELPTEEAILTLATNPAGRDWKGVVSVDSRSGLFTKVTLDQDGSLLTNLTVGDQVRLQYTTDAWSAVNYITDTVAELESNTTFYLSSGLSAATPANKLEVYHPLDVQEQADAVQAISENYANKRMYCVFPGNLGKYGTYVSAAYGAASIAGMVGSVVPQQGLTNIEVNGYDDIPYAYGLFSYDQLNQIAGGGTLIIMQDTKGGTVYVRHQVSTATKDGNLNTTEMSMVKNLDSISFYFADLLAPFIGRYNVTPELVSVLRTQIQDGLNYLGSLTSVGLLGPQIILTNGNTKIRTLEQHPSLKDRILAVVDIELPAPLNVIEFHIVV